MRQEKRTSIIHRTKKILKIKIGMSSQKNQQLFLKNMSAIGYRKQTPRNIHCKKSQQISETDTTGRWIVSRFASGTWKSG